MNPAEDAALRATAASDGWFDGVDLEALAACHGTPLEVYSAGAIRRRIDELLAALDGLDALVCYAVKANSNAAILRMMAQANVGADIVSAGELQRSLRSGIAASRIVFSGVGKSTAEIGAALDAGVGRFNVESADELEMLQQLARDRGVVARAAARINPDVDAQTHAKISTGRAQNKFGVSLDEARGWFETSPELSHVRLDGLHVHIGSQILSLEPFRRALQVVDRFRRELDMGGHPIASVDVGGGLGVCYREGHDRVVGPQAYVETIRHALDGFSGRIILEPGRWLVAEAGVLLTRVVRVKLAGQRRFLVIDAAMNDLARPSLYGAWHDIVPVTLKPRRMTTCDIVGPVCETGDTFARDRQIPECEAGDLLMIKTTGAYAASMASTYNSRPLAAEVLVDEGRLALARSRQTYSEMIAGEIAQPVWQDP